MAGSSDLRRDRACRAALRKSVLSGIENLPLSASTDQVDVAVHIPRSHVPERHRATRVEHPPWPG
jgi:hypothetical protein